MKKKLNKHLRIAVISLLVILVVTISGLTYKEVKHPGFKEKKVTLYSYKNNATVNYKVFLVPNFIFTNQSLDEGEEYISTLVDYVQASFNYEFSGERQADIQGNYEVVGTIEGFIERLDGAEGKEKKSKTIWKKEFVLIPKTDFQTKDKSFSIKKDITLKLADYDNFVKSVTEVIKVNSNSKLTVWMNVDLKANTDKGTIEEKMSPLITIPLNAGLFNISKNETNEKPGAIEETKKVQLHVNKTLVTTYSILLGIITIVLLYLILFTLGTVKDPFHRELHRIFKKHGSRLVALDTEISSTYENQSNVKTFDDLVRIADEIGKPIMYRHSSNAKDITLFYVFDNNSIYFFDLKDLIEKNDDINNKQLPEIKSWNTIFLKRENTQSKDTEV